MAKAIIRPSIRSCLLMSSLFNLTVAVSLWGGASASSRKGLWDDTRCRNQKILMSHTKYMTTRPSAHIPRIISYPSITFIFWVIVVALTHLDSYFVSHANPVIIVTMAVEKIKKPNLPSLLSMTYSFTGIFGVSFRFLGVHFVYLFYPYRTIMNSHQKLKIRWKKY